MKSLPFLLLSALATLAVTACGGGGQSAFVAPASLNAFPVPTPTAGATAVPTGAPTTAPTSAPTVAPTIAPTAKPALHVAGALASVFTTNGLVRRSGDDMRRAQSTNLGNGQIPAVIGATSPYFGSIFTSMFVWAATPQNTPIPQTTLTAVPANVVSGPVSVASVAQDNGNAFALTFFDWTVAFTINKVAKGNVVATFGDGTTGSVPVYVYDQWYATCASVISLTSPMKWAYLAGVPTGVVVAAPTDMSVDCIGLTVTFTNGATKLADPLADAWGNVASAFTSVLSPPTAVAPLTIPVASLKLGTIYIAKLSDGGYAKIMPLVSDGVAAAPNISGISIHDSPSGSGSFPF